MGRDTPLANGKWEVPEDDLRRTILFVIPSMYIAEVVYPGTWLDIEDNCLGRKGFHRNLEFSRKFDEEVNS